MVRFYKRWCRASDLIKYDVVVGESDLFVMTEVDLRDIAIAALKKYRRTIEEYIRYNPGFRDALGPWKPDKGAPEIVQDMIRYSHMVNVGPMATVAGAIAEYVGRELCRYSSEVIVENGGDIFIKTGRERIVAIYAGSSPFSGRIGLRVRPSESSLGICTSSGTVGHSLSFGRADAVVVISGSAMLADAAATCFANLVISEGDVEKVLQESEQVDGVIGVVVVKGEVLGVRGNLELVEI